MPLAILQLKNVRPEHRLSQGYHIPHAMPL